MEAFQLDIAERVAEQHRHHGKSQFFVVWGALLLTILMGLSLVKAALIIGYFMHMKYEISRMKWLTMCSLVACLALMMIFFPDALRIITLGVR
jgi:caa(3)-type oxidase subunit IV